jgi:biopolymer transport protein ExbD
MMLIGSVIVLALGALPQAAEAAPAPAAEEGRVIKTLPGIVVDTKAKEVRLEGRVCLQQGGLELLVCGTGTREYESVIAVKAKPSHVTFALALLGLAPGKPGFMTEGGAFSPPAGAVVEITARFSVTKDGKTETVEVPAWKLLRPSGSTSGLERALQWVYVGQPGEEALRAADTEGTVVCLSNFTEAVLDVPFESTSVNADLFYEANPEVIPPPKTPVELILHPTGERIEAKKVECEVVLRKGQQPVLDGRPVDLAALTAAVNAMPADVRTTVLRADPQEAFGRVMEIHDILRDALMQVKLAVLAPAPAAAKPGTPPLAIAVEADDKIRAGDKSYTLEEFRSKAQDILTGIERVVITAAKDASYKTVAEVMAIARQHGAGATLVRSDAAAKP